MQLHLTVIWGVLNLGFQYQVLTWNILYLWETHLFTWFYVWNACIRQVCHALSCSQKDHTDERGENKMLTNNKTLTNKSYFTVTYHIDIMDEFCSTYVLSRKRKMLLIIIYSEEVYM